MWLHKLGNKDPFCQCCRIHMDILATMTTNYIYPQQIFQIFFFYYNANRSAKFGYMSNSPVELTGKLSNHVSVFHNNLIEIR
jgi:hypothetical protein